MSTLKQPLNHERPVVRQVREDDFRQLPKIYRQSLKDNPEGFVQDVAFHGEITTIARRIINQKGAVLVAELSRQIVGFGALQPHQDRAVEMCKLHVSKDYQGMGIGRHLSQNLMIMAGTLGYQLITLHVTATQNAAIRLYEKLGFYKTDQRIFNVKVNEQERAYDTIFMEYPLISALN